MGKTESDTRYQQQVMHFPESRNCEICLQFYASFANALKDSLKVPRTTTKRWLRPVIQADVVAGAEYSIREVLQDFRVSIHGESDLYCRLKPILKY